MRPAYAVDRASGGDPTESLGGPSGAQPRGSAAPLPSGYSPQQIRRAYGIDPIAFGTVQGDGAGQTIALVDAFDDPRLVDSSNGGFGAGDLGQFDRAFQLPDPPSFLKLNEYGTDIGNGTTTGSLGTDPVGAGNPGGNWEVEEALDVEWAHAIAPGANLILVECNSTGSQDLDPGLTMAAGLPGVSVVSMSWSTPDSLGEQWFDHIFTTPSGHQGVTFVAGTGDAGSPGGYPAYSPNVLAVGGTSLSIQGDDAYGGETAWPAGGGGISQSETEPAYQESVQSTGMRTIPDVSFDADPSTGVAVYDSYDNPAAPWVSRGGTSLAAPCWAGLIAIADQGRVAQGGTTLDGPSQTLPALYALPAADFHDITSGSNGGFRAGSGYDEVTGLGTPVAHLLVPELAVSEMPSRLVVTAGPPGSVTAGNPFGLTIAVEDRLGNLATSFDGDVTLAPAGGLGGGAPGGMLTVAANQGVATFTGLTLDTAGTGYAFRVSCGGLTTTAGPLSVTPGPAAQLVVTAQPWAAVIAGSPFELTVAAEDSYGNLVTTFNGEVTVTMAGGPAGGTLDGVLTIMARQGVASFSGLSLNQAGAGYTLRAAAGGLTAATTLVVDGTTARAKSHKERVRPLGVGRKPAPRRTGHSSRITTTSRAGRGCPWAGRRGRR